MADDGVRIELVVLDFEGVCTPSHNELIAAGWDSSEMPVREGCVELVEELRSLGIQTAVLSNEILVSWAESVPILGQVDHVVSCADNGIFKPDRRAFQRCAYLAKVDAEAVLVVDDHIDNVRVAQSLGMAAEFFNTADPAGSWTRVRKRVGL